MPESTPGFKEQNVTQRDHDDADIHLIGSALASPTQDDIAATIGSVSITGDSPYVARADHEHKIGPNVITGTELGPNSVGSSHIVDGAVGTAEIAASAVTSAKIGANQVTGNELAADSVGSAHIVAGGVGTSEIASGAVTNAKLGTGAVTAVKIAANSITASELADNSVGANHIIANGVGTSEIANGAVTSGKIGGWINFDTSITTPNGNVYVGKSASDRSVVGCELLNIGRAQISCSGAVQSHLILNFTSATPAGSLFVLFRRLDSSIGSISQAGVASGIAYNTTSDEILKENIREIPDFIAEKVARDIQPMMYNEIVAPGVDVLGYVAQRVAASWPQTIDLGIVTPGHGNPEDRTFDKDGNETTEAGVYVPWQMDYSKLLPVVHAAWQATDRRVAIITNKAIQLVQRINQLEARIAALESA